MSNFLVRTFCIAAAIVATGNVQAAFVVGFDIPQTGTGYTSIAPISGGSTFVTASPLFRTNTLSGFAFSNHFYFSNWNTSVNLNKYYSTTLTVDPGKILNLTTLTYSIESTAPNSTFHVRSSLDGFVSDIDSFTSNGTLVTDRSSILAGPGPVTGSIEFRFYATTINSDVRMGFANHLPGGTAGSAPDNGQNIRFNGSVSVIPEPSSSAAFVIGAFVFVSARLRRRLSSMSSL